VIRPDLTIGIAWFDKHLYQTVYQKIDRSCDHEQELIALHLADFLTDILSSPDEFLLSSVVLYFLLTPEYLIFICLRLSDRRYSGYVPPTRK
jgi:hypothetical protein